jgi:hypothetical protein
MENFTQSEKELLQKLNKRAMVIVELENVFKAKKVPVNVDALHDIETEELEKMLANWADGYYLKEIENNLK